MQKSLLAVVAAGFLLSACQTTPPAAKAELSDEAKIALAWAQSDVKEANKAGALWIPAADALKKAQAAAAKNDSATAIKDANLARELVKLGLAQKNYRLSQVGD